MTKNPISETASVVDPSPALESLEARRAAAQARLSAAEARRAARAKASLPDEVARLEREAKEQEAIDCAESSHGEVACVRNDATGELIAIVRKPEAVLTRRFHDAGKFTLEAKDKYGRPCVVWPDAAAYAELASGPSGPMVQSAVADAAASLAGVGRIKLEEK